MKRWFTHALFLAALLALAQLAGVLVLDDAYPLEMYRPVLYLLKRWTPEAWQFTGNILLGLLLLLLAVLLYSSVLAMVAATVLALLRRPDREGRGDRTPGEGPG